MGQNIPLSYSLLCTMSLCINSLSFPRPWLITRWLTRRVSLVEQELLTLPEHLSSPPVFSGVRVTRSLVLCVMFVDCCLSFCPFSFGHCVVCSSMIYRFWLPLWYLQTLHTDHADAKFRDVLPNSWIWPWLQRSQDGQLQVYNSCLGQIKL